MNKMVNKIRHIHVNNNLIKPYFPPNIITTQFDRNM